MVTHYKQQLSILSLSRKERKAHWNQISFLTLEDCRDLPPVTDNMHGYRLLVDEAQVLDGITTSSLLVYWFHLSAFVSWFLCCCDILVDQLREHINILKGIMSCIKYEGSMQPWGSGAQDALPVRWLPSCLCSAATIFFRAQNRSLAWFSPAILAQSKKWWTAASVIRELTLWPLALHLHNKPSKMTNMTLQHHFSALLHAYGRKWPFDNLQTR